MIGRGGVDGADDSYDAVEDDDDGRDTSDSVGDGRGVGGTGESGNGANGVELVGVRNKTVFLGIFCVWGARWVSWQSDTW